MVIHDFNISRTLGGPNEADAPLAVYADRMLSRTVATKRFKAIGGGDAQVIQNVSRIQHGNLSNRYVEQVGREASPTFARQSLFNQPTSGALYHRG